MDLTASCRAGVRRHALGLRPQVRRVTRIGHERDVDEGGAAKLHVIVHPKVPHRCRPCRAGIRPVPEPGSNPQAGSPSSSASTRRCVGRARLVALAAGRRDPAAIPRRSSGQIARSTKPAASSRPTTRESALWERWTMPHRVCMRQEVVGLEPLQHLVLAHSELVLALERTFKGAVGPRVALAAAHASSLRSACSPGASAISEGELGRIIPCVHKLCRFIGCSCIECNCMYSIVA